MPGIRGFRVAAVLAVVIPYAVSRATESLGLATTVGLAFAVAAATFAPLLMLGVWWRRLSTWGAMAGLVVGGAGGRPGDRLDHRHRPRGRLDRRTAGEPGDVGDPAGDRHRGGRLAGHPVADPAGTTRTMVRLHTPERVALARSRIATRPQLSRPIPRTFSVRTTTVPVRR